MNVEGQPIDRNGVTMDTAEHRHTRVRFYIWTGSAGGGVEELPA